MGNKYDSMEEARSYDRSLRIKEDGFERVGGMSLTPQMNVLDIGSGPGILALPLAGKVREVTAVEPSAAMRILLKQHMEEEGISNIRILPYLWEEVPETELGSYDLVIASYSLNMPDFKEAALKMNRHSTGEVILYWFAGETSWERDVRVLRERMGWPTAARTPGKIGEFYQILYQAGIYCDICMLRETSFDREYETFELALKDMRERYEIPDKEESVLISYLEERLVKTGHGWYYRDLTHYARMTWKAVPNLQG